MFSFFQTTKHARRVDKLLTQRLLLIEEIGKLKQKLAKVESELGPATARLNKYVQDAYPTNKTN